MRRRTTLSLAAATTLALVPAALHSSCAQNGFSRFLFAVNEQTIRVCCDDVDMLPAVVGSFQIQIFSGPLGAFDGDGAEATFTVIGDTSPVTLSIASGSRLAFGSNNIDVSVTDCDFQAVDIRFRVELTSRPQNGDLQVLTQDGRFSVINTCPPPLHDGITPQFLVETIVDTPAPGGLSAFTETDDIGVETCHPSTTVDPVIPSDLFAEVFQTGSIATNIDADQAVDLFNGATGDGAVDPLFLPGFGPLGLTLVVDSENNLAPQNVLVAWMCALDDVPLDSPDQFLEYSLYLDRDNDSMNNFTAPAPFTKSVTDDTDYWIQAVKAPGQPWQLLVVDAQTTPPTLVPSSRVRVLITDQIVMFIVPTNELSGTTVPGRFQAFSHGGDFGLGPTSNFSIDVVPDVDTDRRMFNLMPDSF